MERIRIFVVKSLALKTLTFTYNSRTVEAGRRDFSFTNSIKAGQTQLINQPSPCSLQFCCSERKEEMNRFYSSPSIRCTPV